MGILRRSLEKSRVVFCESNSDVRPPGIKLGFCYKELFLEGEGQSSLLIRLNLMVLVQDLCLLKI